jgi:hypothetical protein
LSSCGQDDQIISCHCWRPQYIALEWTKCICGIRNILPLCLYRFRIALK